MMDWTDRHCRRFHRQFSRRALLYTEMVTTGAVLRGPADRLLACAGGAASGASARGIGARRRWPRPRRSAVERGFDEVNLNVGCPSDRVRSGAFGAALMLEPSGWRTASRAMRAAAGAVPVTVKCRIGVDDQVPA
jgi:tRNA-dihydrouridine synthase A